MVRRKPNTKERLEHILRAIDNIFRFTSDMDLSKFMEDEKTQLAIIKLYEIIGEAAYHLEKEFKNTHNHIEWRKMEGLRHVLVHDYHLVDSEVLWYTKNMFLGNLREKIKEILDSV